MMAGIRAQSSDDPSMQLSRVAAGRAVEGALSALDAPENREQIRSLISETVSNAVQTAVAGAVATLAAPEQREQIRSLVSETVSDAVQTAVEDATRELAAQLGPDGDGPLAASLTNASSRISAGAVRGVRGELMALFPDCGGPDARGCIELQLQQIARSTAAGFTKGVRDSLGLSFLFVAFVLGVAGGVLATVLLSRRPQRPRHAHRVTANA